MANDKKPDRERDVSNDLLDGVDYDGDAVVFDENGKLIRQSRLGDLDAKPAPATESEPTE